MEIYPTIPKQISDVQVFAFDKIDGSNIRAEWTRKNGFTKFGSRKRLLDASDPLLGEAIGIFKETHEEVLSRIFTQARYEKATAFLEFSGENSFAGYHEDEAHKLTLFDVHVYKKGLLLPQDFLKLVEDQVETPELLHFGKATAPFIESVKKSTLEGMTFEGVVCKGERKKLPVFFKVKSDAWLQRLKTKCGGNENLFQTLA